MALLDEQDRQSIWEEILRQNRDEVVEGMTRAELRAAIDAADQWAEDNAASYNLALPQPARSILSPSQKAKLLMHVLRWRWNVGASG